MGAGGIVLLLALVAAVPIAIGALLCIAAGAVALRQRNGRAAAAALAVLGALLLVPVHAVAGVEWLVVGWIALPVALAIALVSLAWHRRRSPRWFEVGALLLLPIGPLTGTLLLAVFGPRMLQEAAPVATGLLVFALCAALALAGRRGSGTPRGLTRALVGELATGLAFAGAGLFVHLAAERVERRPVHVDLTGERRVADLPRNPWTGIHDGRLSHLVDDDDADGATLREFALRVDLPGSLRYRGRVRSFSAYADERGTIRSATWRRELATVEAAGADARRTARQLGLDASASIDAWVDCRSSTDPAPEDTLRQSVLRVVRGTEGPARSPILVLRLKAGSGDRAMVEVEADFDRSEGNVEQLRSGRGPESVGSGVPCSADDVGGG